MTTHPMKVYSAAEERRSRWKPFGVAALPGKAEVTSIDKETKLVLRARWIDYRKADLEAWAKEEVDKICKKVELQMEHERRVREREEEKNKPPPKEEAPKKPTGTYVPPSRREGVDIITFESKRRGSDENTVVIKELNQVIKDDVELLVKQFGETVRINCIFEDRENPLYVKMAFVSYRDKADAQKAIKGLHRKPLNSMLLNVTLGARK